MRSMMMNPDEQRLVDALNDEVAGIHPPADALV